MIEPKYDLQPGQTLGRNYYVLEYLGGGWEGEVYKVEERRTGIVRAAKLFYSGGARKKGALLKYAHKLHKLRMCPIVIQYHHRDVARVGRDQIEFLVSDYVSGEVLSDYLARQRGKRLSAFEALHLFYALVEGVETIHYAGEYHGDIHSDNIIVSRRGLTFEVHLLDFFDFGRSTRQRVQEDVYDLITVLFEMIGGAEGYRKAGNDIKQIVMGRKHNLIRRRFREAGHLRLALENLDWDR
jgi:tRNA A-37 threonylcarbamoyl transferase component Bud32